MHMATEMAELPAAHTTLDAREAMLIGDEHTPTTPKPAMGIVSEHARDTPTDDAVASTPTRHSFGGISGQLALPDEPFTPPQKVNEPGDAQNALKRDSSMRSSLSQVVDGGADIEMGEGEDDDGGEDDGSDNESAMSDSQRPSKKKKGQRFFCTDFPPCQLSFTRSEHLARHIRCVWGMSGA